MLSAMSAQLYTTTKQVQDRSRRSWYRLLFYDHPEHVQATGTGAWHNIIYSANTMILSCCYLVDADGAISPGPSNVPQAPESTDAGNASRRAMGFDAIIFSDMERADEDLPGADIAFPLVHHITLDTLFDFQTDYWGTQSAASSMPTLDDELALWEILDMDADGEEVPGGGDEQGFKIDTLVDSILSSS
ncbi:hypothetical protein C2E23DRAFT_844406 [Lenzites betulinus]|nr:hypothetical protein C2E23DRAFT_844406 [Lenzites betulinus]